MSDSTVKTPSLSITEKDINFVASTAFSIGAYAQENGVYKADAYCPKGEFINTPNTAVRLEHIDGELYAFSWGGDVYKKTAIGCELLNAYIVPSTAQLVKITWEGQKRILAIDKGLSLILGEGIYSDTIVDVPYGDVVAVFEGVLYVASGQNIYFSNEYDYVNFSTDIGVSNVITLEVDSGNVCGIRRINGALYVIAEHQIFALKAYGDHHQYTLYPIKTPYLDVDKKSVSGNEQFAYFVSGNKVCSFDGKTVKQIDTYIDNGEIFLAGRAVTQGDRYILPISVNGKTGKFSLCVKDSGEQFITPIDNLAIADGGYAIDSDTHELYMLEHTDAAQDFYVKLKDFLLDDAKYKSVTEFKVWAKEKATLKMTTKGVSSEFDLVSGCNHRRINDKTGKLGVEIFGKSKDIEIENLSVGFAKRGN